MAISNSERILNETVVVQSKSYPDIWLEDLRKTTKILSQDRRSPGRDLDQGPPEQTSGIAACSESVTNRIHEENGVERYKVQW